MPALRLAAACVLAACPFSAGTGADARSPGRAMVEGMNSVRTAHDLPPLRYSRSLGRSSARFSRLLLRQDRFGHAAKIMASERFSKLGEILGLVRGRKPRVSQALATWVASPGHAAVLLSPSYRYAGAGWARGWMEGRRAVVWTAQFGA